MRTIAIALLALAACASNNTEVTSEKASLDPASFAPTASHRDPEAEDELLAQLSSRRITLRAEIHLEARANGLIAEGYVGHFGTPIALRTGRVLNDVSCTLSAAGDDRGAIRAGTTYTFFPDQGVVDDANVVAFSGDATANGGGVRLECTVVDAPVARPTYFDF